MPWSLRLPLLMLGINSSGVALRLVPRWKDAWMNPLAELSTFLVMSLPLVPLALLASVRVRRAPLEAVLGGGLSALTGGSCCFVLLDPKYNQDANIGLGLYWLFGVVFPLGLAYVLGVLLGKLWTFSQTRK